MEPDRDNDVQQSVQRFNPTLVALLVGVLVLVLLLWFLTGRSNPDQDKVANPQISQAEESDLGKRCSSRATYDLIKGELFRRAVQARGGDAGELGPVAAAAVVRMNNAVMEGEDQASGTVNCSGSLSLDLPPGVAVAGGAHSIMADVDYAIDRNGSLARLGNIDALVASLATLTQVAQPPVAEDNVIAPEQPDANVAASVSANVQPGPATRYPGRPSFDCSKASTPGEAAVCSDSGLSALDLNMSTQYRRALAAASSQQKQALQSTRDRFLAYRDHCSNRQCIADAYVGRMREIRDIMEGRWQPPR